MKQSYHENIKLVAIVFALGLTITSLLFFAFGISQYAKTGTIPQNITIWFVTSGILACVAFFVVAKIGKIHRQKYPHINRYIFDKYLEEIQSREMDGYLGRGAPKYSPNIVQEIREKLSSGEFDEK